MITDRPIDRQTDRQTKKNKYMKKIQALTKAIGALGPEASSVHSRALLSVQTATTDDMRDCSLDDLHVGGD